MNSYSSLEITALKVVVDATKQLDSTVLKEMTTLSISKHLHVLILAIFQRYGAIN